MDVESDRIDHFHGSENFCVSTHLEEGEEERDGRENKERGEKIFAGEAAAMSAADVADPPTNLNPLRSNLAVVGRESGRVNIGAVSFNEPCAPLLFRKRARRRSFGRKRFPSAAAAATVPLSLPRSGAKFMRPIGLKPIECLSRVSALMEPDYFLTSGNTVPPFPD